MIKNTKIVSAGEDAEEKKNPHNLLVEIQISTITMENSMEVHKNSKARTTI
jgi:hypothetical protein